MRAEVILNQERTLTLTRWILCAAIALFLIACERGREEIYLLPEGFEGPFMVKFLNPDAPPVEIESGAHVYRIPEDGILRARGNYPERITSHFYYLTEAGDRKEIPYSQHGRLEGVQVFRGTSGMGKQAFMVGRPEDWDNAGAAVHAFSSNRFDEVDQYRANREGEAAEGGDSSEAEVPPS